MKHALWILFVAGTMITSSAGAAEVPVFFTDFEGVSSPPAGFSGAGAIEGTGGYSTVPNSPSNLGTFQQQYLRNASELVTGSASALPTTLTLTGLPAGHTALNLSFLLGILDTWDGVSPPGSPDFFDVTLDGATLLHAGISNCGHTESAAPAVYASGQFAHGTICLDTAREGIFNNVPHTASSAVISWVANGAGWQGGEDESWAIDNVRVSAVVPEDGNRVPEPTTLLLLASGAMVTAAVRGRRRH